MFCLHPQQKGLKIRRYVWEPFKQRPTYSGRVRVEFRLPRFVFFLFVSRACMPPPVVDEHGPV